MRVLADVWGADVTVIEAELTLASLTPAMAELVPLADASKSQAHEAARATGSAYAERQLTAA